MSNNALRMGNAGSRRLSRKQKRLMVIAGLGLVLAIATGIIMMALRDQIVFFFSPTELAERPELAGEPVRVGGLVADGSFTREGQINRFTITDGRTKVEVTYSGILPDLFREGQGVVADGSLGEGGMFEASSVLAKHDENYMPREVEQSLKDQGVWQGGE